MKLGQIVGRMYVRHALCRFTLQYPLACVGHTKAPVDNKVNMLFPINIHQNRMARQLKQNSDNEAYVREEVVAVRGKFGGETHGNPFLTIYFRTF
jgi:hypothetical protein